MTVEWQGAWESVIHHPLFGIGITLGAYQLVLAAYEKTRWIFLQPVLVSMLLVIGVLLTCGLSYAEYRKSTEIMGILLGPATVALAVPLYLNLRRIRQLQQLGKTDEARASLAEFRHRYPQANLPADLRGLEPTSSDPASH